MSCNDSRTLWYIMHTFDQFQISDFSFFWSKVRITERLQSTRNNVINTELWYYLMLGP